MDQQGIYGSGNGITALNWVESIKKIKTRTFLTENAKVRVFRVFERVPFAFYPLLFITVYCPLIKLLYKLEVAEKFTSRFNKVIQNLLWDENIRFRQYIKKSLIL
jgi:hypothetical protein